uniref:hypothetical protein n=1 Tax=uncultured Nostoc sp. TaxID=340711 RepID=UPI0035CC6984
MLELGPEAERLHAECGEAAAGMDVVIGVRWLAANLVEGARGVGVAAVVEFLEDEERAIAVGCDRLCLINRLQCQVLFLSASPTHASLYQMNSNKVDIPGQCW